MKIGLIAPQGWKGEYDLWDAGRAWERTTDLARDAEALGFEALWVFDHVHPVSETGASITFESFSTLAALAATTERIRLGQLVACTGFRNAALTAKVASTIDVISDGRLELGLGAGWKEDEWRAYGYGFPTTGRRLAVLAEHLEIIRRMLAPGRATFEGKYATVHDAANEPKGVQDHIPIIVGGNGTSVTWRLAARFADELNLVYLAPLDVEEALGTIAARCDEEGRDPDTLRLSVYVPDELSRHEGQQRIDLLGDYAELGVDRLIAFQPRAVFDREAQARLAEDARVAGIEMAPADTQPMLAAV